MEWCDNLRRVRDSSERSVYRFGVFELDPRTGELRKQSVRIKLQDQPLQILSLLIRHPGELVSREEIQKKLWAPGTFVDYDNAINSAVRKLRDALGDGPENPRYIETLARRGYRFIGTVSGRPEPARESEANSEVIVTGRRWPRMIAAGLVAVGLAAALAGRELPLKRGPFSSRQSYGRLGLVHARKLRASRTVRQ